MGKRSGVSLRQMSLVKGQRGWKGQPVGISESMGTLPGIAKSFSLSSSRLGMESMRPRV